MKGYLCNLINKLNSILTERKLSPVASTSIPTTHFTTNVNAKADSGASKHFFKAEHMKYLKNVIKLQNGSIAQLPNNTIVQATHKGLMNFHKDISEEASEVLIFPHVKNESLLSIGQLCDDGCMVIFTKEKFFVTKHGKTLFHGKRNASDGLWDYNSENNTPLPSINYIITKNKAKSDLARYYHASLFSPSISTLTKAINNGNLLTWPEITTLNFQELIGTSLATELGHLDQSRKNLRTTKIQAVDKISQLPTKTKDVYINWLDNKLTDNLPQVHRKIYSDQTGRFPY